MNTIMITLNQIRNNPYFNRIEGWSEILEANGGTTADFYKKFPVSSILDSNLEHTLSILRCLPEHDILWRKFACWCALQVVDNAKDERVNKSLEVVKRYSEGLASNVELSVARSTIKAAAFSAINPSAWSAIWSAERSSTTIFIGAATSICAKIALKSALWADNENKEMSTISKSKELRNKMTNKLRKLLDTGEWE